MFASGQTSSIVGFPMETWHSAVEKLLPFSVVQCVLVLQLARLGWIMKVLINESLGQRSSE